MRVDGLDLRGSKYYDLHAIIYNYLVPVSGGGSQVQSATLGTNIRSADGGSLDAERYSIDLVSHCIG